MGQNPRLDVLQVIGNLYIGGAQEVLRTLVDHLALNDCQPIVCTFIDGPLRQTIEHLGIKVVVLPRRHRITALPLFIIDMIRIWKQLADLIKENEIDIVQTHLFDLSTSFLMLILLYTTKLRSLYWTVHNVNFGLGRLSKPKFYVYRWLYRLAARKISGFIAVSDQVKKAMLEAIGPIQESITVIYNGVDVRRYGHFVDKAAVCNELRLEPDVYLAAVVGTLKEQKGHRYLIEACASIVSHYPNWHLLIVGAGELKGELQAQAQRLELDEHIHFLGNRSDVPDLLAISDLFILPSLWEGLPMALIEAMASGLPIVATEVSGTVRVMVPGETGLLVPPGDVPKLVEAILQLVSDPEQAQTMGIAAKRRVEEGSGAQKQADEHLALYRRLS